MSRERVKHEHEAIAMLEIYSRLAHRSANDAQNLMLETRALASQIDATISSFQRTSAERRLAESWFVRVRKKVKGS